MDYKKYLLTLDIINYFDRSFQKKYIQAIRARILTTHHELKPSKIPARGMTPLSSADPGEVQLWQHYG